MHRTTSGRRAARRPLNGWAGLTLAGLLATCGECRPEPSEPPKPELSSLTRFYSINIYNDAEGGPLFYSPHTDRRGFMDGLGVLSHTVDLNPQLMAGVSTNSSLLTRAPGETGLKSSIFSDADGTTYWVEATAPAPTADNRQAKGVGAELTLDYYYRKDSPDATLSAVITHVILEGLSYVNPVLLGTHVCPQGMPDCVARGDSAEAIMQITVLDEAGELLQSYASWSILFNGMQSWKAETFSGSKPIWTDAQMTLDPDVSNPLVGSTTGTHAIYKLNAPLVHEIPLADVPERFWVSITVTARARNGDRVEEPYRASSFRDPLEAGGPDTGPRLEHRGLTALKPPGPRPEMRPLEPCSGPPDPSAGTLQFELVDLHATELGAGPLRVKVTRTAGSQGPVSVAVTSADGTAIAGADYQAVSQTLRFDDGFSGALLLEVNLLEDDDVEPDETFTLALSDVRGCATLGAAASATVTVHDLDLPTYTLGGTVLGLEGSGLVLRSNGFDVVVNAAGPFVLPSRWLAGTAYELEITVQPNNPLQVCRVTNGQGTIGSADVTDMTVVCDPPAPTADGGSLDPSFGGGGGKVAQPSYGSIISMALQPDGRIVALTDFNRLLRFQLDGALDPTFGAGGVVSVTLSGHQLDAPRAVTVQADGAILVAGLARAASDGTTTDDMGVRRYQPNGEVDTTFGTAGFVRVDIAGRTDDAVAIAVQPNGAIVLGGVAIVSLVGASDLALARLDATGALDASFGAGGKLTANIGGSFDSAAAMALQPDGAIVLVGRAATGGGATPDTSVLRVSAAGVVELALKLPLTADWDEATGVGIQPDGRIVLALEARAAAGGLYQHALARLQADGALDESFGAAGVALNSFSVGGDHARALVLLADGRIVTAGFARHQVLQLSDQDDFLITRHRADGSLDTAFGAEGRLVVDFFGAADGARALLAQPDARVVVGGLARGGDASGLGLLRLLP